MQYKSRDSSVGIATGYGVDGRGIPIRVSFPCFSQGLNRPGREADHSPPPSDEAKNLGLYIHSTMRLHLAVLN
ncbi:hypothetical protein B7P43_G04953 [Cryptotermes secundus]|uniref:Uncharacterized protein n=1 Tax=Cryptotermes secundus TaxID=105785 RepID=A0A2J7Q4R5_9NEOP|nr:hypothetical protein B7P43_G04953 [Cryptotermes secundus]